MIQFIKPHSYTNTHQSSNTTFCQPQNHFLSQHKKQYRKPKSTTQNIEPTQASTPTDSRQPLIQKITFQLKLPQCDLTLCSQIFSHSVSEIDWGLLLGLVNGNEAEINMIGSDKYYLKIGQNQEIPSLEMLRPYSLDHLVFIWKQHSQSCVADLVNSSQHLIIIFAQQGSLEVFLKLWVSQFLQKKGEFRLRQNQNLLEFNIIKTQFKTILTFSDSIQFESDLSKFVQDLTGIHINQEELQFLLDKITIREYIDLKKQKSQIVRKVRNWLQQIQLQISLRMDYENQKTLSESSWDSLIIAPIFAKQQKQPNQDHKIIAEEEDLMIFNFNHLIEQTPNLQKTATTKNINTLSRARSKSYNQILELDQYIDDELFDKY